METPELIPHDLLGTAFTVSGTEYEIVLADPPRTAGRWKQTGAGWFARVRPTGAERQKLIVGPAETPEQALALLVDHIRPRSPIPPRVLPPLEGYRASRNPHGRRG